MKYMALDCETTGIDLEKNVITEIAFVVADTQSPEPLDVYTWRQKNLETLNLWKFQSWKLQREALKTYPVENTSSAFNVLDFFAFIEKNFAETPIILAGKNAGIFDVPFVKRLMPNIEVFHYRILELGSLFGFLARPRPNGMMAMPSLSEIKIYCGFEDRVEHSALRDAIDVIRCVAYFFQHIQPKIPPPAEKGTV